MDIRKLQRAIVDGLEDVKGQNIAVFNTEHLSPLFERVIIASGTSNRQTKALAASVRDAVKASGHGVLRTEGEANGEWIIVDCGAAVVHLMQPTIREYYHLEEIWGDKPVKMKIDSSPKRLVKAEEDKPPARPKKTVAGKASTTAAKKPAARKPVDAAPAARKATSRAAPQQPAVGRKTAATKTLASKAAAGKTAAGKTAAGKTTASRAGAATRSKTSAAPIKTMKVGAPAARKTAPRKTAAKSPAAGVTRTVGVKRTPAAAKKASRKT